MFWPPRGCPFELSEELTGIYFTGVHSDYYVGDTWYPSWASDDKMYSGWTDGRTDGVACTSYTARPRTGNGVMIGDRHIPSSRLRSQFVTSKRQIPAWSIGT